MGEGCFGREIVILSLCQCYWTSTYPQDGGDAKARRKRKKDADEPTANVVTPATSLDVDFNIAYSGPPSPYSEQVFKYILQQRRKRLIQFFFLLLDGHIIGPRSVELHFKISFVLTNFTNNAHQQQTIFFGWIGWPLPLIPSVNVLG